MVATATMSAFFPVASPVKTSTTLGVGGSINFDHCAVKFQPASSSSRGLHLKANAQATPQINNHTKVKRTDENVPAAQSQIPRTFINQLPDWSMLLAAITTIFLAAEKQWTLLDWKPRRPDMSADPFGLGRIVQDGLAFRQSFAIRSYEIGVDRTASIETLMNHLQETALNHVRSAGLLGEGFGSTPEMSKRDLIWVVTRMQILVDCYPSWPLLRRGYLVMVVRSMNSTCLRGDIVEVDTWVGASGKNGMRRDWLVRDCITGQTLTRATSVWVMMNKRTRKLSKIPEEVREEIEPYFMDRAAILDEDTSKVPKVDDSSADHVRTGLSPRWSDLDVNQHVNNVKYIGWILESAPISILENHELASMTLEYRRECGRDSMLQSLTTVSGDFTGASPESGVKCKHLLRLESGAEIVRGRTEWRPKRYNGFRNVGQIPSDSACK